MPTILSLDVLQEVLREAESASPQATSVVWNGGIRYPLHSQLWAPILTTDRHH